MKHIWSLDGTAPGPGPTLTPDLRDRYGTLSHDPGLEYVVATDRVNLIGPIVASQPGLTLRRIQHHPWRLHDTELGVSDDGWISGDERQPRCRRDVRVLRPGDDARAAHRRRQPRRASAPSRRPERTSPCASVRSRSTSSTRRPSLTRPGSSASSCRTARCARVHGDDRAATRRAGARRPDGAAERLRLQRVARARRAGRLLVQRQAADEQREAHARDQPCARQGSSA